MEAASYAFPNPAKPHCSPRVPFQRILAMVEDEKPLFALSLYPNDVRVEWPSSRKSTTGKKCSVDREIVSFLLGVK
jgi:hypothetical protein